VSYTTIKAIWVGEKIEDIEELRNSHGSATVIWNEMCKKYYGTKEHCYMFNETLDKLWPRWRDLSIPEYQRSVLMMTYDFAYVSKKDYARAAFDIKKFFIDFPTNPEYVNHWPRIAELFEADLGVPAIGFQMTSCGEELWDFGIDEDGNERSDFSFEDAFDVYRKIDSL